MRRSPASFRRTKSGKSSRATVMQRPQLEHIIRAAAGSTGAGSPFHQTFGYYAHGVAEETAVLPAGWKDRLILIRNENTGGGTGLCLEVHDLAVSKLVAGREKDFSFVQSLLRHQLAKAELIRDRLAATSVSPERRELCLARLQKIST